MTAMPDSVDGTGRRHRVVVIGSGFGGLTATKALKRAPVDVTMIARTQHHLFQPLLYQVATGILSEGEIAPSTRRIIRNHRQRNQHQSRPPKCHVPTATSHSGCRTATGVKRQLAQNCQASPGIGHWRPWRSGENFHYWYRGGRRPPRHLRRAGRHGRSHRHLHQLAQPQPVCRRAARRGQADRRDHRVDESGR